MKTQPNVLFLDIGGVLLTNGWTHEARQKAATQFGFDYTAMNTYHEMIFDIYEQGSVSLDHYLDTVLFYEPRPFGKEEFIRFMQQQSQELPQTLQWLLEWKKTVPGLRIFSLNNEPRELHDYRVETFGLKRLYDGFVCSCDVGLRKPDPAIYRLALRMAGVRPEECLYIDDREALVRAGRWAGLPGWQHKTFEETKAFLERTVKGA
jgi:putative hydrolase of the HAD superfamily